jgi:hypothetical protein
VSDPPSRDKIEYALERMRSMLACDGYHLSVERGVGRVVLTVTAGPDACAECLVPRDLFLSVALDALRNGGAALQDATALELVYPSEH